MQPLHDAEGRTGYGLGRVLSSTVGPAAVAALLGIVVGCSGTKAPASNAATILPEVAQRDAAPLAPRAPTWSRAADPAPPALGEGASSIAVARDTVVFSSRGSLCAFAERSGDRRWCRVAGRAPSYAAGQVAYSARDGFIEAVDARTGAMRWRFAFTRRNGASSGVKARRSPVQVCWGTPGGFLIARLDDVSSVGAPNFGYVQADGKVSWAVALSGVIEPPVITPPSVYIDVMGSGGAGLTGTLHRFELNDREPHELRIDGALTALGTFSKSIVVLEAPVMEPEPALVAHIVLVDSATGSVAQRFRFAPEFAWNLDRVRSGRLTDQRRIAELDTEDNLYMTVGSSMYRYTLRDPTAPPIRLFSDARYVSGPYRNAVYAARGNGLWSFRVSGQRIRSRLLFRDTTAVTSAHASGRVAYFGFEDGRIVGTDVENDTPVFEARHCRARALLHHDGMLFALCGPGPRVDAYDAPLH